jgi:hypothetical protein
MPVVHNTKSRARDCVDPDKIRAKSASTGFRFASEKPADELEALDHPGVHDLH